MNTGIRLWPEVFSLEGYVSVWTRIQLWRPFLNNVIVTAVGTLAHVILCSMAGYVMMQKGMPGKKFMVSFVLITMMIPSEAIMIPVYIMFKELSLLNSLNALIISGVISGFSILLMRNYFQSVPFDMMESGRIDGANDFRIFATMYLPLAKSGLATIALFEFVSRWNQFTPSLFYITNQKLFTLQAALRSLVLQSDATSSNFFVTPNIRMAGVMIAMLPLILIYPFIQKYFVKGIMVGSTKE
jgi:putative aldouronate transport system permease protein